MYSDQRLMTSEPLIARQERQVLCTIDHRISAQAPTQTSRDLFTKSFQRCHGPLGGSLRCLGFLLQYTLDLIHSCLRGEAVFFPEDGHGAVFHKMIRPSHSHDRC